MTLFKFLRSIAYSERGQPANAILSKIKVPGLFLAGVALLLFVEISEPHPQFPSCDDQRVHADLSHLYDNRRLLHATNAINLVLTSESPTTRHCRASIVWSDGTSRIVDYEFDVVGRRSTKSLSMWVDFNGGMNSNALRRSTE